MENTENTTAPEAGQETAAPVEGGSSENTTDTAAPAAEGEGTPETGSEAPADETAGDESAPLPPAAE